MPFSAEELQEIAEGLDAAFGDADDPKVWFIEEFDALDRGLTDREGA